MTLPASRTLRHTRLRAAAAVLAGLCAVGTLSACGSDGDDTSATDPTQEPASSAASTPSDAPEPEETEDAEPEETEESQPAQEVVRIQVTVADGDVSPKGDRIPVDVGQPVVFDVTADAPGELHVHGNPEQTLPFEEGKQALEVTIDRPGVVEVETHDPDLIVAQLEVS